MGLNVPRARRATGCDACLNTGYQGRFAIAELLLPQPNELGRAILNRDDSAHIESLAIESGMVSLTQRATDAVTAGRTSAAEVRRILGFTSLL